jgi:hypothetical protein
MATTQKTVDTSGLDSLKETTREPVTATGAALLQLIKDAPQGYLELTQAEGAAIVQAGQAAIDPTVTCADGLAAVRLTPAGQAVLVSQPARIHRAPVVVTPGLVSNIPAPPKGKGGKHGSKYPFDTMNVGDSFHIPATLENTNPLASVQSSITMARAKYAVGVVDDNGAPVMETVTIKDYAKDAAGKITKDSEGKRIIASERQETRQQTKAVRDWVSAVVDATDPNGVGARVWRTA